MMFVSDTAILIDVADTPGALLGGGTHPPLEPVDAVAAAPVEPDRTDPAAAAAPLPTAAPLRAAEADVIACASPGAPVFSGTPASVPGVELPVVATNDHATSAMAATSAMPAIDRSLA